MAGNILKNEDSSAQNDIISRLEMFPHVLENIFQYLDVATTLETAKVSTTWQRLLTNTNLWKWAWKKNVSMSLSWKILSSGIEPNRPQLWARMKEDDSYSYHEACRYVEKKISPTWKILLLRMEHLRPELRERMQEGDSSSYHEACRYVEENTQQIAQCGMKNFNFQALADDSSLNCIPSTLRMNEKYVCIGGGGKIRIFDRWNRQLLKGFLGSSGVVWDMQLNERFLAVQLNYNKDPYNQIDVFDVQKRVFIQKLGSHQSFGISSSDDFAIEFALGLDIIVISGLSMQLGHLMVDVYRWDRSTGRFLIFGDRLNVTLVDNRFTLSRIYVDENYLIVDLSLSGLRLIKVFGLETIQLLRERQFEENQDIRKEYHDHGIVVQTRTAEGRPCVARWDVNKDTVQPMADHPSQFLYSFAMSRHPIQIVIKKRGDPQQLLLVQRDQPTRHCWVDIADICLNRQLLYFDGVQMLASKRRANGQCEIVMADLVETIV